MSVSFQPNLNDAPRVLLTSYDDYEQAQRAVDALSDAGFPLAGVGIVGSDLRLVEAVTGRLTVARAAGLGAFGGAWWGAFVGLLFFLFTSGLWSVVLWSLLLGTLFGAIFGAAGHAASGGRRDFASVQGLTAGRYDVVVPADGVERARTILAKVG